MGENRTHLSASYHGNEHGDPPFLLHFYHILDSVKVSLEIYDKFYF